MKATIIAGPYKGLKARILTETQGTQRQLAGGKETQHRVTALVEGMLHPITFDPSEISKDYAGTKR